MRCRSRSIRLLVAGKSMPLKELIVIKADVAVINRPKGGATLLPKDGILDNAVATLFSEHLANIPKTTSTTSRPTSTASSTSSPTSTPSSPTNASATQTTLSTATLIGLAIGLSLFLLLLGVATWLLIRRRRRQRALAAEQAAGDAHPAELSAAWAVHEMPHEGEMVEAGCGDRKRVVTAYYELPGGAGK